MLARVAEGDHQAFASLLEQYHTIAYRAAVRLTDDAWLAEDVVQEVFLKLWLKRATLPDITHFRAWLVTLITNALYDQLRRKSAEKDHLAGWLQELLPAATQPQEESGYEELLRDATARLSPKQLQAFTLIKKEGYSREETARLMSVSPETVKSHLEQAMRSIRAYCIARLDPGASVVLLSVLLKNYF
ncbi:MAG: RNA polymerase sigma factor [Candidatus Pseudobacter hemicellulosilyticus]|uniref:RNA polymerase sigma factor n=1 Tax=Candidatus Pseudobacter hemicellulosilyticus TaxID=3121375 RepID=A0AAJ5WNF6_9BACT|nr:MAG: RNA polymerase sigma factor [Pseudobacter sp.]